MRVSMKWSASVLVLAMAAGGCGDDGGPGGSDLTESDKTALINALTTNDQTGFGAFAAFAIEEIGQVGKLDPATSQAVYRAIEQAASLSVSGTAATSYDAVGFAIDYSYDLQGEVFSGWFLGVVGWNGISGSTVQEIVVVGGGSDIGSLPSSTTGTIEDGDVFASYQNGSSVYFGTSGVGTISSSTFSGSSTDCSASEQGITVQCSVQIGQMSGDFDFVAQLIGGTGTYTQPAVMFSGLPSLRMVFNITD